MSNMIDGTAQDIVLNPFRNNAIPIYKGKLLKGDKVTIDREHLNKFSIFLINLGSAEGTDSAIWTSVLGILEPVNVESSAAIRGANTLISDTSITTYNISIGLSGDILTLTQCVSIGLDRETKKTYTENSNLSVVEIRGII